MAYKPEDIKQTIDCSLDVMCTAHAACRTVLDITLALL